MVSDGQMKRLLAGAGLGAAGVLAAPVGAHAADLTVNTTADENGTGPSCSLREALSAVNAAANGGGCVAAGAYGTNDTVLFQSGLSGDVNVNSGDISILKPVRIQGPGADARTIRQTGASRIFDVDGTATPGMDVTITGLRLTGGNPAGTGGAVNSTRADLSFQQAALAGNTASGAGGAVAEDHGSLTVSDSTLSDNSGGEGGAIATADGATTITSSTIVRNETTGGDTSPGGGVMVTDESLVIRSSTISGNHTDLPSTSGSRSGGGIWAEYTYRGSVTVTDSTLTGNAAVLGGAIYLHNVGATIQSSTLAANDASYAGGGISSYSFPTRTTTLSSTLIGDDTAPFWPDCCAGTSSVAAAFSLIESTGGKTIDQTGPNLIGPDPQLGVLRSNGGPTETMKPSATSPAIDQGHAAAGETTDQRGLGRPFDAPTIPNASGGDGADIGAVELQASDVPAAPPPGPPAQATFDLKGAIKKCKKKFPKGPKRAKCIKKAKRKAGG